MMKAIPCAYKTQARCLLFKENARMLMEKWLSKMEMVAKVGVEDVHLKNTTVFDTNSLSAQRISKTVQNLKKVSSAKL